MERSNEVVDTQNLENTNNDLNPEEQKVPEKEEKPKNIFYNSSRMGISIF